MHDDPDDGLYLASNPDLAHAFEAGLIRSGLSHWQHAGAREQRDGARPTLLDTVPDASWPRARPPDPTFDAATYLEMNADLKAAFGTDAQAAARHWAEHGSFEGRFGPGDAPFRDRRPDLAGLLSRPFGIDLYLDVEECDPVSAAARRLLRAFRREGLEVSPRPFARCDDVPLVRDADLGRAGTFRISVIAASPQTTSRLVRTYPDGHFDASYVIGLWPRIAFIPHLPDYPTFGAVDEVWVTSFAHRDRIASLAPIPVRHVALGAAPLPSRDYARAQLALPEVPAIMLDADLGRDGQGGLSLPAHVPDMIEAFAALPPGEWHLVLRADARSIESAEHAACRVPNVTVLTDQRRSGQGSLVLAACDAMIASVGLEVDVADAHAAGRLVLPPDPAALRALPDGAQPPTPAKPGSFRGLFHALGLDAPSPRFATLLGRARLSALASPARHPDERLAPSRPVTSLLLDARLSTRREVSLLASALAANPHPFWELCVAGLDGDRADLAADPRVRLARADGSTRGRQLNAALRNATGGYVVIARSAREASALTAILPAIVPALAADPPDILLSSDPPGCTEMADRILSGGRIRPLAIARGALERIGGFRDRFDPALEYDTLLRLMRADARIAIHPASPSLDADPPSAEEAARLALLEHLHERIGPLSYAEPGLRAGTHRIRTGSFPPRPATIAMTRAASWSGTVPRNAKLVTMARFSALGDGCDTEFVVLLDDPIISAAPYAFEALFELLEEQEIGAAGGCVRHADTTIHHAGLMVATDGAIVRPDHGAPGDGCGVVYNPHAVGGVLAVRRSVLLQAGGLDASLAAAEGATFDHVSADFCLRLRQFGLRTTYTPFATFTRAAWRAENASPNDADRLFRARWSR